MAGEVAMVGKAVSGLAAGAWRWLACWGLLLALLPAWAGAADGAAAAAASAPQAGVPLVIGNRLIHTFRAPLGAFGAADRAEGARLRILKAIESGGEGWTSVRPHEQGSLVEIDGQPMFVVLAGDAPPLGGATTDQLANAATRVLQKAWREAGERSDPRASGGAALRVLAAFVLVLVLLLLVWRATRWVRDAVTRALEVRVQELSDWLLARRISPIFLKLVARLCLLLAWLLSLLLVYLFLAYALDQFAHTRALGEGLFHALSDQLLQGLGSVAAALPGLFVAVLIFLVAWVGTQLSSEVFGHVASGRLKLGLLDAHTAPVTRHIVNACLWLFALAMAYPYLPGAQTEAFKGLTVILGIMVSIGASGAVGQVFSGVVLVYTRALRLGDYVHIHDCEGTVTEIGLFVTRLRSGLGSEYALPNAVVLGNVTRNYSRQVTGVGHVLEIPITIGYDTPWRQVHALLKGAAVGVQGIAEAPAPYVVQTDLSDYYVAYSLVVCVSAASPVQRARVASALNASILDQFNRFGVQIMSPSYRGDPAQAKVVPEAQWYAPPARRPEGD